MATVTLSTLEVRVLRALPSDNAPGRWPTPAELGARVGVDEAVARSCLVRLRGAYQAEHDGEYHRRWARTRAGDVRARARLPQQRRRGEDVMGERRQGPSKWSRPGMREAQAGRDRARMTEQASWKTYRATVHVLISAKDKRAARKALESIKPVLEVGGLFSDASVLDVQHDGPEEA